MQADALFHLPVHKDDADEGQQGEGYLDNFQEPNLSKLVENKRSL